MKHSLSAIVFVLIIIISEVYGRVQISENIYLDAEFRPRIEFDNRDFSSKTGNDAYTSMRIRIGLRIDDIIENTSLYLMIGDSRMLGYSNPYLTGNPPGPNGFDNNLGVNKVYIEVKDVIKQGAYLKIGRMSNDQGRSYIFGPGNWNLLGPRTYDGIKVGYSYDMLDCNLWSFFGSNGDRHWYPEADDPKKYPDTDIDYKRDHTLTGLDLSLWKKTINILLFLDLDQNPVADTINHTTNIALKRTTTAINIRWRQNPNSGHWIDFDAASQVGNMAYGAGNGEISAYMLAGDWSLHFEKPVKSWIGFGFHILSGWDGDQDKVTYFDDNYSSKHKTFGFMDYFKNPTDIKSQGLQDLIIRAGLTPLKELDCQVDFHKFNVEKSFKSVKNGKSSNNLGYEIDTQFKYAIKSGLTTELGIDLFTPDEKWKYKPGDISTFIYLALTASI
jgi:hypothetical protein